MSKMIKKTQHKHSQNIESELTENLSLQSTQKVDESSSITKTSLIKSAVFNKYFVFLKSHALSIGIIFLLALSSLGAGLKYLEEDANREIAKRTKKKNFLENQETATFLNKINPFLPNPAPNPTPQLTKEYIYAGSQTLAVEDANAHFAPPTDLAVWRPSSGVWWVLGGAESQQFAQSWGQSGDFPAPGDYDGDGKTDLCIFRSASNSWWILKSSNGNYYSINFGTSGDKPAQADFDGDGKTDIAVFRPSNGNWYINQSASNTTVQGQYGLSTDTPTPKDFDGDGRADLAVWRGSNKTFYSLNSSNNQTQISAFTQSGTTPVVGDYDGDGRADYAIRNGTEWIIRNSSNGQTQTINWQQSGDIEVQNDYDGDGKVDIAVWRASNGNWYIRQSSRIGQANELRQVQWGISGDIPVPAFYRR